MAISRDEIEAIGFVYDEDISTDEYGTYFYIEDRSYDRGKPLGTRNVYRLDNLIGTDYYNLRSDLERKPEFEMWTRGFNGDLETITELFDIFEFFLAENTKI